VNHWFTQADAPITKRWVKRFDATQWTIDFPRGAMGAVISGDEPRSLTAHASFLRKNDLVGLIFESRDRHVHPAHQRQDNRDYSGCQLVFRWRSTGLLALDAVNGPTLTIEGHDAEGQPRTWYVRLWNYAVGSETDALVTIDFDALDGGYNLTTDASRVDPRAIDRLFISLVPQGYDPSDAGRFAAPVSGSAKLSDISCEGYGSVLSAGDAIVPPIDFRICTAYDDMYHLTPERVIDSIERLGFRGVITHYIGMSHYFALGGNGLVRADMVFNAPALAWHEAFAASAKRRGFNVIWSLSYELLDMFCPGAWKQRASDGSPALTGYDPPSTLLSPACQPAIDYLRATAVALSDLAVRNGLAPRVQIGEPWWWVTSDCRICIYDVAAKALLGNPPVISDVRQSLSAIETAVLDAAGVALAQSTARISDGVRAAHPGAELLLLVYLPGVLDPSTPELRRANLPVGWSSPAFDVIQLEDYSWVAERENARRRQAIAMVTQRLDYPIGRQHYLAGFVASASQQADWQGVIDAAEEARARGTAEVFLWALPQVLRDGLTLFGEESDVQAFDDVLFPIEIGAEASVSPGFSTTVVTSASGHEYRNANWSQARLRFDAGPGIRSDTEIQQLLAFFRARRGSAIGFRFRDPYDFSSAMVGNLQSAGDQVLGVGDGVENRFALTKSYGEGTPRRITRPRSGTVRVSVAGVEASTRWTLDGSSIQFDEPPQSGAEIRAGFLFDVPVRFEHDRLDIHRASFLAGEAPSVALIEVREDAS
jgi:uncharacterized protein (TIGR02217 family)